MTHPLDLPAESLAAYLEAHVEGFRGPLAATKFKGGQSNPTYRIDAASGAYVLRRKPPGKLLPSAHAVDREFRVLQALHGSAVPVARPLHLCMDDAVVGTAFYLMEPIDGYNATTSLPAPFASSPEMRRQMGLSLVDGIAALGAQDYIALGLEGFGKVDNYLERQVGRWKAQLESYAEIPEWDGRKDIPGVARVGDWLDANRAQSFRPGIIHGDYHLANVMFRFDEPRLAAIVDWELTTIGDPLLDLGWLLATWPEGDTGTVSVTPWEGFPSADELVAHYAAQTTRDLSGLHWYSVLACYKLGIILEGTYARACAGKAPKETGDRLHASTIGLFERALRWIS